MSWIESHEDLPDHRKTQKLADLLGYSIPTAVGTVHLLWYYTVRTAWETGDLTGHRPLNIARACWYDGKGGPERFIKCLQEAGFLDGMKVHEWTTYARELIYQRTYNKSKRAKSTAVKQVKKSCITGENSPLPYPTLPYPTIKRVGAFVKPTVEEIKTYCQTKKYSVDPQAFYDFYESKGWMVGRSHMKNWQACVRTWERRNTGAGWGESEGRI